MPRLGEYSEAHLQLGIAAVPLIVAPDTWINRRVETVELLSHEETRRRVSVDFTLSKQQREELTGPEGLIVPISVLTKEPRRNFDLRDEGGAAIPVLGRKENGELAHVAVLHAAVEALNGNVTEEDFELLEDDLGEIVLSPRDQASDALAYFIGAAESGDRLRSAIWASDGFQNLLETLWANYVLFAVLTSGTDLRRILKYSYGDDFGRPSKGSLRERLAPDELWDRVWKPGRDYFNIECPGAWRGTSFHLEIAVPEELRIETAELFDLETGEVLGPVENEVNRASLYAAERLTRDMDVEAEVEIVPERHGRSFRAAATGTVVSALLWLGVLSGLDTNNPGSAVSLLLAGAALFSGVSAVSGEHVLVKSLFAPSRRGLIIIGMMALIGSATLAMQVPDQHPTEVWWWAAAVSSVVSGRLIWAAIRAPA